jgi:alkylation response protein AidB-like acyl-CoA dehydrogenase
MDFAFTAEQNLIRDSARAFFATQGSSQKVRAILQTPLGYDPAVWSRMACEMGWAGMAIPERFGGSGLGLVELSILQHEQGRQLYPSPFFATVCLAAPIITALGTEAQKSELLGRSAAGQARMAVALTGSRGTPGCAGITAELQRTGKGYRVQGESSFVIYGHAYDVLLVAARAPGTLANEGVSVIVVEAGTPGVTVEGLTMLDLTRPMARLKFDVAVDPQSVLGEAGDAGQGLDEALQLARIALAAEAVGGAEWTLEMTTAYAKQRMQFGRPIGSFQAVKHRLADMMVLLEAARSASWYAACVADEQPGELAEAAAIAKAYCSDAFFNCASNAIQLHGGIGFTWEHDAHLYFKRARAVSTLLGNPAWQREQLAALLTGGEPVSRVGSGEFQ